jgi:hypothetical protein
MAGFEDFAVHAVLIGIPVAGMTTATLETVAIVAIGAAALIETYWEVIRSDA